MSLKTIKNENGVYVELPRDKIKFMSKEAEIIFDLSMENERLEMENEELKKQLEEANKKLYLCTPEIPQNSHGTFRSYVDLVNEIYELKKQQQEFIKYLEDEIYSIEPKGTGINYNCEYDSEEDYINAMKEMTKLITLKAILQKYKEIIASDINVGSKGGNK